MAREINLIIERKKLSETQVRVHELMKKWSPLLGGLYVVVALLIIGSFFYLEREVSLANSKIESEEERIKTLERNEGLYLLLKDKAATLTKIYDNQYPFTSLFSLIKGLESEGITVNSVRFNESGNIRLDVFLEDSDALDHIVNNLILAGGQWHNRVELISIEFNIRGSYNALFEIAAPLNIARQSV